MKYAYAFPGAILICMLWLCCFKGASPGMAQSLRPTEICSKSDKTFRQSGILKRLDEKNYVLLTPAGEMQFNAADFETCPPDKTICPADQVPGPNGCSCPANRVMSNGRCVERKPIAEIPSGNPAAACKSREALTIQGSSTVGLGIMPELIKGFAGANRFSVTTGADDVEKRAVFHLQPAASDAPCFDVTVLSTGSDTAKEGIADRVAQIGMSSRYYDDGEIEGLARAGGLYPTYERGQIEHVVALDAVGIVVNNANTVGSLELCQIAQVFAGKIRDWRELNGRPGPIDVHIRTGTSGTFETFKELVMDSCHEKLAVNVPSHGAYPDLLDAVAADAASIGFAPAELVDATRPVKALSLRASCGIEQAFNAFNVKSEDYPLARRLYIFTPITVTGYARQFENFILTDPRIDDLVSQAGAIDLKIDVQPDSHAGSIHARETEADPGARDRFDEIARHGRRLSITYRFALGSEKLDTKARQDIVRLTDYLRDMKTPPMVYLAGFTDDIGSVGANLDLATKRAQGVRRELLRIVPYMANSIQARGFGKVLPVNCNDTPLGKAKNRRVEVYVVP